MSSLSPAAVTLGQVEDFSVGIGGWTEGGPSPNDPVLVTGGGPDGSDHLMNISIGSGPGSRLAMFNQGSLWTGDFLGINAIILDVRNADASSALSLRLGFNGPGGWFATEAVAVPAAGDWQLASFGISPGSLTYVSGGTNDAAATLGNVSNFEIFSAVSSLGVGGGGSGIIRGDRITSDLRIDNISAIPEPSSLGIFFFSGLILLRRKRG